MTRDDLRLLKYGLFWAAVVATFAGVVSWLQSRFHSRAITVAAVVLWCVFAYVIFYRDAHKNDSN